jgi:hypothetical protein
VSVAIFSSLPSNAARNRRAKERSDEAYRKQRLRTSGLTGMLCGIFVLTLVLDPSRQLLGHYMLCDPIRLRESKLAFEL